MKKLTILLIFIPFCFSFGQCIEGDCDNFRLTNLSLFVKFNDVNYSNTPKVLTNYSIENIQIVD